MSNNELKNIDVLNVNEICNERKLTKEEFENELLLAILSKMCDEKELELSLKQEDLKEYAPKLDELFRRLGLPCNHFIKTPVSETYDQLKLHLVALVLRNNYGTLNEDYNKSNLNINRYMIVKIKKENKNISNIIDEGYRIITNKPLEETNEENINIINPKINLLLENIDMINLITCPNNYEAISFKEYIELFIDYQKYFKQRIKEIFYYENLDNSYTNIEITKYIKDNTGSSIVIEFEKNYGEIIKPALYSTDFIKYIWDKSRIIKRKETLDELFEFVDKNESYFDRKNVFNLTTKDKLLNIFIFPQNEDKFKTLSITYNDGKNIINIKSNYLDGELTYDLHINNTTIHILNEDIEPILENLYINIEFLPKFIQDYIVIKEKKSKRKKRWIEK